MVLLINGISDICFEITTIDFVILVLEDDKDYKVVVNRGVGFSDGLHRIAVNRLFDTHKGCKTNICFVCGLTSPVK